MPYDEMLEARIARLVKGTRGVTDKHMFGGVAWLLGGNMFVGIVKSELMVRVGKDNHQAALADPAARTMDFTGKPMIGYVFVRPEGFATDDTLDRWIQRGLAFAATLPAKTAKPKKKAGKNAGKKAAKKASARRR
jgi:TfoX/Sxy family transcriptional regulator of competence genes